MSSNYEEVRASLIEHMVEVGELKRTGVEDIYEDMGGHSIHERHLDGHIRSFLDNLSDEERVEVIAITGGPRFFISPK